jgi:hypothetical protein
MPTLVLPSRYTSDTIRLWKAALELGWTAERLQDWHPPAGLRERDPVLYGEPMFAVAVAEALGLALVEPTLDWLTSLPPGYLNRQVRFLTFGEVEQIGHTAFFKPADDKCFPAAVYVSGTALRDLYDLPAAIPILISDPVEWEVEYRCFIADGVVRALSPYLRDGELVETEDGDWSAPSSEFEDAKAFASMVLADPAVPFPPAVVLDIGIIRGRGWSVVEANPAWSSGIYGCSSREVLAVIQRACVKHSTVRPEDRPWILSRDEVA